MQKNYTTALFDMDGTLVTLDAVIRAVQNTFDHYGLKQMSPQDIMRTFIGHRIADQLPRIYPETRDNASEIVDYYVKKFVSSYQASEQLAPYAREVLAQLKDNNINIGIITTRRRPMALSTIDSNALPCDCLISNDDVSRIKPSPEPVIKAMDMLHSKVSETIMIGDHMFDMMSAKAAGCTAVGVLTGVSTRIELLEAKADYVINNLGRLPNIMGLE